MRWFALLASTVLLAACQSKPVNDQNQFMANIESTVTINWGIQSENSGPMTYQHEGIPGNLAVLKGTIGSNGYPLKAVVLGPPLDISQEVPIKILGVLEQAGASGLISTIIATTGSEQSLMDLETQRSGSLAVLEAGLVKLEKDKSRSLGFQSADYAIELIQQSK